MSLNFVPISPGQARALGRLGSLKDPLPKLVIAIDRDNDSNMIVVPASGRDKRRWDISKGGCIKRSER